LCRLDVLGLRGQDVALDSYVLGPEDDEMLDLGIYGECHLRCLVESEWGALWASRWLENFTAVRGWPVVTSGDVHVLRNPRLPETTVIRDDGWIANVADSAFLRRQDAFDGHLVPVRHELNLPLAAHAGLGPAINAALADNRAYPLVDVVNALGLGDRLWSPQALSAGSLNPSRVPVTDPRHVTANAVYAVFLPHAVTELLLAAQGRPG
jgi:hypothetical protein